jgi:hypothetical protein
VHWFKQHPRRPRLLGISSGGLATGLEYLISVGMKLGISSLNPAEFTSEYYPLRQIAQATGIPATILRAAKLRKYRFTNADWLKVVDVNRYFEDPEAFT